jgi:heterodisulfide reductase subunit C
MKTEVVHHYSHITPQAIDPSFIEEVKKIRGGEKVLDCIQCGVCAGSCHARFAMDHSPMQIIKMAHLGMKQPVLESSTIWICASCYSCATRCPRGIDIPALMSGLKNMAMANNVPCAIKTKPKFHKAFTDIIKKYGRMHETQLQAKLINKTNPKELLQNASLAMRLWKKGKVKLQPPKLRNSSPIEAIFENALKKEEEQK